MAGSTDFVPFATAGGANVTSQADYIAESTTSAGFESGTASSADCNKVWRQATFQAAVLANLVANILNINVADDGNLSNAVTNLTNALNALIDASLTTYATIAYASNSSNQSTGTLSAARLPGTIGSNTTGNAATATEAATLTMAAQAGTNAIAVASSTTTVAYNSSVTVTVGGALTAAGGYYIGSDMTTKENVELLDEDESLKFVCSLDGFTHNYVSDPEMRRVGLSAQQIRSHRPEAVSISENGKLSREMGGLDADFAMAFRALLRRVQALEAQNKGEP